MYEIVKTKASVHWTMAPKKFWEGTEGHVHYSVEYKRKNNKKEITQVYNRYYFINY